VIASLITLYIASEVYGISVRKVAAYRALPGQRSARPPLVLGSWLLGTD